MRREEEQRNGAGGDEKVERVKKLSLSEFSDANDEVEYWSARSIEEKLEAVEILRRRALKIKGFGRDSGDFKGLRRVLRVTRLE